VSLWSCPEHGLVGPSPCCGKSSLANVTLDQDGRWNLNSAVIADREQLQAENDALRDVLREVCNELDYYGDQAGPYFREKGGCDETLARARALLGEK
jgi:hypothetical protein